MNRTLAAIRSLSAEEMRLLTRAWIALLLADLLLRVLPLPRVQEILAGRPGPVRRAGLRPPARTARLVAAAARHHVLPIRCLPRALALQALLVRQGLETELKIGVRKLGGAVHAHAWLEQAGVPVGESESVADRFHPLQRSP